MNLRNFLYLILLTGSILVADKFIPNSASIPHYIVFTFGEILIFLVWPLAAILTIFNLLRKLLMRFVLKREDSK